MGPASRAQGSTVARIVAPAFARARLKGRQRGWPVSTQTAWSGQSQTLLVLGAERRRGREWVKLLLPVRPNGSAGWVPRDRAGASLLDPLGSARSHGWIRVDNRHISWMAAHVPASAPVRIKR